MTTHRTTEPGDLARHLLKLARTLIAGVAVAGALTAEAANRTAPKPDWSPADMPEQAGRIVLVTGGTSGMGYEDALLALSRAGAEVIIAARNAERGQEAIERIREQVPDARVVRGGRPPAWPRCAVWPSACSSACRVSTC